MKEISGVIYSYYFLCERKVWLYAHDVNMEHESERVQIGKIIDETSYSRERKHILIDDCINIDYIHNGIVYEVKKSAKEKQMAINQIKYYLYILLKHGIKDVKGILAIPVSNINEEVILTNQDIEVIKVNIEKIKQLLQQPLVPPKSKKKACTACSYYEFCYV